MKCVITAASEAHGRLIAYLGGGVIAAFSNEVAAQAKQAVEHAQDVAVSSPNGVLTVSSFCALGGLVVVCARFIFDVFKYFDQRRLKSVIESEEQNK